MPNFQDRCWVPHSFRSAARFSAAERKGWDSRNLNLTRLTPDAASRHKRDARSTPLESCRSFQLFHDPVDDRTCKCSPDHPERARHKIFLVQIWVAAAIGRTIFIYAAAILFQKRTRRGTCYPWIVITLLRADQISLNELFPRYLKTPRQPVNFLFAQGGLYLFAAVRALGTVDSRPYAACRGKDTLINLLRLQPALALQESAEPQILCLF